MIAKRLAVGLAVLGTGLLGSGEGQAALQVTANPGTSVGPSTTVTVTEQTVVFTDWLAEFAGGTVEGDGASICFRGTASDPDLVAGVPWFVFLQVSFGSHYQSGAQAGTDNWIHITSGSGVVSWANIDIGEGSFTPLLYVHDPDDPTGDITLPEAVAAATPAVRDVQIKVVDFVGEIIELHNFGPGDQSLDGWRFCTHDEDQVRQYSGASGLNGVTVEAGTSLFIYFNDDAPVVDGDHINRSSTGGSWAAPLDAGPYGMSLYINGGFGDGSNIADHLQWSYGGVDDVSADERSDEAEAGGVWTDQTTWVATSGATTSIHLTDASRAELHGPNDFLVLPDFGITGFARSTAGVVDLSWPVVNNLEVSVERNLTLNPAGWAVEDTTTGSSSQLTGQTEPEVFYRLSYPLP